MKNIKLIPLILFMIILTGCPYQSSIPIDSSPSVKFPEAIIGKWKKTTAENDYFTIFGIDGYKFEVTEFMYNSEEDTYSQTKYVGFLSDVSGTKFLNIIKDGESDYYLYKFIYENNQIKLYALSDYITQKFGSPSELKKFIKKNLAISYFYQSEEVYERKM